MKQWTGSITISETITVEDLEDFQYDFEDWQNPTESEIRQWFERWQYDDMAGSNTGSERIANAELVITAEEE